MSGTADFEDRVNALRDLITARRSARLQRLFGVAVISLVGGLAFGLWFEALIWIAAFAAILAVIPLGFEPLFRADLDEAGLRRLSRLAAAGAFIASLVYTSFTFVLWSEGVLGAVLSVIILSGSLFHVATTAYVRPLIFWANAAPLMIALLFGVGALAVVAGWGGKSVSLAAILLAFQVYAAYSALAQKDARLRVAHREALAHAAEARAANQAKSEFVSAISHDLRTPLNGMRGGLALLARSGLRGDQSELVCAMQGAADAQVRLLNDLLDLAKIEAGKIEIEAAPYAPEALARDMIRLFAPAAAEKGLSLHLDIAADVPALVVGDAFRVRQIITNLLSNAIKFTSEGGVRVAIRAGRGGDGAGALCWSVRDTGIGLTPDARDRLFVAFVQGGADISRQYGGTGLGLAISKRLAGLLQGDIKVRSEPGAGSEFTLETPLRVAPAMPALLAAPEPAPARLGGAALIADDHAVSRLVLTRMLEEAGWRVVSAANGTEAVALAAADRFDLILLDGQMPGLDGISAAQAMRLGGPNQATPIALVSADGLSDAPDGLFQARLLKPYEPAALLDLLAVFAPAEATAPTSQAA